MSETRTVHDPFVGRDVQTSDRLVDRLRGKYASGPHLPNGIPEFGWKQFQSPPIQHEAAERIDALEAKNTNLRAALLRITAIIETQTEPDIDAMHDVARDALNR